MTNPTCDPVPIERPDVLTLYKALLCEVHMMRLAQYAEWTNITGRNRAEKNFRESLVDTIVENELKTLNVTVNTATLFIYEPELPY